MLGSCPPLWFLFPRSGFLWHAALPDVEGKTRSQAAFAEPPCFLAGFLHVTRSQGKRWCWVFPGTLVLHIALCGQCRCVMGVWGDMTWGDTAWGDTAWGVTTLLNVPAQLGFLSPGTAQVSVPTLSFLHLCCQQQRFPVLMAESRSSALPGTPISPSSNWFLFFIR